MTTLEAIEAVELALTILGMKSMDGEPLLGIEASGIVARFAGDLWTEAEHLFKSGTIQPDEYYRRLKYWIDSFAADYNSRRLGKKLDDIGADQVELDLLKEGA